MDREFAILMRWWRIFATAEEEPDRAVILELLDKLPPIIKHAKVLPYVKPSVDRVERFRERFQQRA